MTWSFRSFRPSALSLGLCILAASGAHASLWSNQDWSLGGAIDGGAGYDSNLTLSHNGPGDGYIKATPELTFTRRDSLTDLHAHASITETDFIDRAVSSETDYYIGAAYSYPNVENVIPIYHAETSWVETAEPNQYLGRRVKHDVFTLTGEGYVPLFSKIGLRGHATVYSDEYKDPTLNNNEHGEAFLGLALQQRPGLEYSLNVGFAGGDSTPRRTEIYGPAVRSTEGYFTAQIQGEITPKLTGKAYAGFGVVDYTGGYSNRYNLPVGGSDLTWSIDPRRTVVLAVYSGAEYAPDGQSVNTTRAFLSFTNVIVGAWQLILRGGPTHSVFRREVLQSKDNALEGDVEFSYRPSERFRVAVALSEEGHTSDVLVRKYDRTAVSVHTYYKF